MENDSIVWLKKDLGEISTKFIPKILKLTKKNSTFLHFELCLPILFDFIDCHTV